MRKCQTCGLENSDAMNFCVQCGATLAHSPIIVNLQDSGTQKQSNVETTSFNKSMETVAGGQSFPKSFQTIPTAPRPRSYGKILMILGGLFALFFLFLAAGAAIVFYNLKSKSAVVYSPTPSPSPTRSVETKSPTPAPTVSPKVSPSVSSSPSPNVSPSPQTDSTDSEEASADFDNIRVDFDVTEKGKYGMRIHPKFTTHNMKGVDSYLAVFVQRSDGTNLVTKNREYQSTKGQLAVYQSLKPLYDDAVYDDLNLFMPYNEFNLSRGKYRLKLDVDLLDKNGNLIQHLTLYDFDYDKS